MENDNGAHRLLRCGLCQAKRCGRLAPYAVYDRYGQLVGEYCDEHSAKQVEQLNLENICDLNARQ